MKGLRTGRIFVVELHSERIVVVLVCVRIDGNGPDLQPFVRTELVSRGQIGIPGHAVGGSAVVTHDPEHVLAVLEMSGR